MKGLLTKQSSVRTPLPDAYSSQVGEAVTVAPRLAHVNRCLEVYSVGNFFPANAQKGE